MVEYIDNFTSRFINQINKIEERKELVEFIGEDQRQADRLKDLEHKLERINEIVQTIEDSAPPQKTEQTQKFASEIAKLEEQVSTNDNTMKRIETKVKSALNNTIDLQRLSHNLFNKFQNFLQG